MTAAVSFGQTDANKLTAIKRTQGLAVDDDSSAKQVKKKFKKKQPNPLSCKKKKNKKSGESFVGQQSKTDGVVKVIAIEKKKRKRVHISQHVKEMLKEKKA